MRAIGVIIVCLLVPVGLWFWVQYCSQRIAVIDYSTQPRAGVLSDVLGVAEPSGLKGIRVNGHRGLGSSGMIWIKVSATDKALTALTKNAEPLAAADFKFSMPPMSKLGFGRILSDDATKAGWPEVQDINKPEAYLFRHQGSAGMWSGTIVIDRSKHAEYICAQVN
ncbi:MAG: hypothetical protein ACLQVD_08880 [Capsulimonadaceae bacterium]